MASGNLIVQKARPVNGKIFAYVRLCSLNGRKNVESTARGHSRIGNASIAKCGLGIGKAGTEQLRALRAAAAERGGSRLRQQTLSSATNRYTHYIYDKDGKIPRLPLEG